MKKYLLPLMVSFLSLLLVHCASDQKAVQPTLVLQEKCDVPIWKAGDSWKYRYADKKVWEHRVLGTEDFRNGQIYIVEDVYGANKKGFDTKSLQFKVDIAPDGRKIIPMTTWHWYYDFPIYVGKRWEKIMTGTADAGSQYWDYVFKYIVVSFGEIKVPAGIFKAFKIEREQRDTRNMGDTVINYDTK